jgi:phosphate-selective porin OprO/OprP
MSDHNTDATTTRRAAARFYLLCAASVCAMWLCLPIAAKAAETSTAEDQAFWAYGERGLELSGESDGSYLWLGLRGQVRYSSNAVALRITEDFSKPEESGTDLKRARFKLGAGYRNLLTAYYEHDLRNQTLLTLRTTWSVTPQLNIRAGQWKANFSRERIDSSGKQQFVDRSIANYWFTVDRQWGVMASGRLNRGTNTDSDWSLGAFNGNGRNENFGSGPPMLVGRWQWNYHGASVPFSQSALSRYAKPRGSLAFAAVLNDSPFTRYSSGGGGQLPGYPKGHGERYRILQMMQEWAYRHGGFSVQQELHWKSIESRSATGKRDLYGGYLQAGWFPATYWKNLPQPWEIAARVAFVDPDYNQQNSTEVSFASNWFFNGHRNKLTAELAWLQSEEADQAASSWRFRLQWDLSL